MSTIMETQTTLAVNLKQNPAVAEAVQSLAIGGKVKLELRGEVKELTSDTVVFKIDAVIPDGYEVDEQSEEAAASPMGVNNPDETIPTALASMVRKKV